MRKSMLFIFVVYCLFNFFEKFRSKYPVIFSNLKGLKNLQISTKLYSSCLNHDTFFLFLKYPTITEKNNFRFFQ